MKDGVDQPLRLGTESAWSDPFRGALLLAAVECEKRARVSHLEFSVENQRLDAFCRFSNLSKLVLQCGTADGSAAPGA